MSSNLTAFKMSILLNQTIISYRNRDITSVEDGVIQYDAIFSD